MIGKEENLQHGLKYTVYIIYSFTQQFREKFLQILCFLYNFYTRVTNLTKNKCDILALHYFLPVQMYHR